jgi:hypothetical protein
MIFEEGKITLYSVNKRKPNVGRKYLPNIRFSGVFSTVLKRVKIYYVTVRLWQIDLGFGIEVNVHISQI